MADQLWGSQLSKLSRLDLLQLRQKLDQVLGQDEHSHVHNIVDHGLFEVDRGAFCSSVPALHQSGRSTARSISSDNTIASEANSCYTPGIHHNLTSCSPKEQDNNTLWPTLTASNRRYHLSLRRQTLVSQSDQSPPVPYDPTSLIPRSRQAAKLRYPCWYCAEEGKMKLIKAKQHWKRHMQDYHYGTGQEWRCTIPGCGEIFYRGKDFKTHLNNIHTDVKIQLGKSHDDQRDRNSLVEIRQHRRVYACGHKDCSALNDNWKDYCDHAAICIQKGISKYSYSRMIRVLLKHHDVSRSWKNVYTRLCPLNNITPSQLQWDPSDTREMRRRLEYHNFEPSLESFLEQMFWLGNTNNRVKALHPPPSNFLSLPPAVEPSGAHLVTAPFAQNSDHRIIELAPARPNLALEATGDGSSILQTYMNGNRDSMVMLDPPPLILPLFHPGQQEEFEGSATPQGELLSMMGSFVSTPTYSCNSTPPIGQSDATAPFPVTGDRGPGSA